MGDATGRKCRSDAEARKARALPLVVAGEPYAVVGKAVGVSPRTVRRWVEEDPRFADAIDSARAHGAERAEAVGELVQDIARRALDRIRDLIGSDDERIALDAAKTAADRFGYPTVSESKVEAKGEAAGVVVTLADLDVAREWARKASGRGRSGSE